MVPKQAPWFAKVGVKNSNVLHSSLMLLLPNVQKSYYNRKAGLNLLWSGAQEYFIMYLYIAQKCLYLNNVVPPAVTFTHFVKFFFRVVLLTDWMYV